MLKGVMVGAFENYGQCKEVIAGLVEGKIDPQRISVIGCYPCARCMGSIAEGERLLNGSTPGSGVLDALLGWLSGAGVLSIPATGSFVVSGPLRSSFASAEAGGLFTITDTLTRMRIPEYHAMIYEALLSEHKVVVAVNVDNQSEGNLISEVFTKFEAIVLAPHAPQHKSPPFQVI